MTPNPYESPRPGEPLLEKTILPSDPLLSLLTEIRDLQRQTLEQNREAFQRSREILERQQGYRVFPFVMMVVAMAFMGFSLYRLMMIPSRARAPIPMPVQRVVPSPAVPPPAPTTFRAYE